MDHLLRRRRAGSLDLACALLLALLAAAPARAQAPPGATLFTNVRIFDGRRAELSPPSYVLVRGNRIERVSTAPIDVDGAGVRIVAGEGRTLMPGLIDAHWHAMMATAPLSAALASDPGYLNLIAAKSARETLLRGFTTVRDMAGPSFALKRAIDEGIVDGPRIWPSGAMISQTSGHGDYRAPVDLPRANRDGLSFSERTGGSAIADGVGEVLRRSREQLMLGASQLKLAAGGGVASNFDPLDVTQFTEAEMHAAVEAAENWGTYVAVHAYTPRAMQMAIRAGVKVIEHGQLMDEATAKLMAEKGVWWSAQPFLDDEDAIPFPEGSDNRAKQLQMTKGTDAAFAFAKKYRVKTAWGTDTLFDAKLATRQGAQLAKMVRWYPPADVLRMATSTNAELLALSGPRAPYKGALGIVEAGALADLLLVDGDPTRDIGVVADPDRRFLVIMKDGRIYKDSTAGRGQP